MKKYFLVLFGFLLFNIDISCASSDIKDINSENILDLGQWFKVLLDRLYNYQDLYGKPISINLNDIQDVEEKVFSQVAILNDYLIKVVSSKSLSDKDIESAIVNNIKYLLAMKKDILFDPSLSGKLPEILYSPIGRQNPENQYQSIALVDAIYYGILYHFIMPISPSSKFHCLFDRTLLNDEDNIFLFKNMLEALIKSVNSKKTCTVCHQSDCSSYNGSIADKYKSYILYKILGIIFYYRIYHKVYFKNLYNKLYVWENKESEFEDGYNPNLFYQTIDRLIRLNEMKIGKIIPQISGYDWIDRLTSNILSPLNSQNSFIKNATRVLTEKETGYGDNETIENCTSEQIKINKLLYQSVIENWGSTDSFKSILEPIVETLTENDIAGYAEIAKIGTNYKLENGNSLKVTPFLQYYFKLIRPKLSELRKEKAEQDKLKEELRLKALEAARIKWETDYKEFIKQIFGESILAGKNINSQNYESELSKLQNGINKYQLELVRFLKNKPEKVTNQKFKHFFLQTSAGVKTDKSSDRSKDVSNTWSSLFFKVQNCINQKFVSIIDGVLYPSFKIDDYLKQNDPEYQASISSENSGLVDLVVILVALDS